MTSSIETRLNEAKDAVVKAAQAWGAHVTYDLGSRYSHELATAVARVAAIESELERSKKPRLMTVRDAVGVIWHPIGTQADHIQCVQKQAEENLARRDAEWIEKAEKLPRHMVMVAHHHDRGNGMASGGIGQEPAILLKDLKSLREGS